jgi:ribosome maturation factor RimP
MLDGTKREGNLLGIDNEVITIEEKIKAVRKAAGEKGKKAEVIESQIPLSEIAETKVLISFK